MTAPYNEIRGRLLRLHVERQAATDAIRSASVVERRSLRHEIAALDRAIGDAERALAVAPSPPPKPTQGKLW